MTTIMMFFKDLERYGIYKDSQFVLSIPQELLRELLDRWQEIEKKDNSPKVENKDSFGEISDEEIEKAAVDILKKENKEGIYFREDMERIIEGAKWYKEQIKLKNNDTSSSK